MHGIMLDTVPKFWCNPAFMSSIINGNMDFFQSGPMMMLDIYPQIHIYIFYGIFQKSLEPSNSTPPDFLPDSYGSTDINCPLI